MKNNKVILIGSGVLLFLLSGGISYTVFGFFQSKEPAVVTPTPTENNGRTILTTSGPKDQECSINGAYFTKQERQVWESRRPLIAMIENHQDSRPQSGLSKADVVYEVVAEGGITRFMAVFYCRAAAGNLEKYDIGPVRSARTYFLDWASEYGDYPLYTHVGGAGQCDDPTVHEDAKALCQIGQYGWKDKGSRCDLDQFALPYSICRREYERTGKDVATEHTMYCDTYALWQEAETRGLTNETKKTGDDWDKEFHAWLFKEDAQPDQRGEVADISFSFWKNQSDYDVNWQYDQEENLYRRLNDDEKHIDFKTKEQLTAKTIVVLSMAERSGVDEHKHLLYETIGDGQALVFQDGQVEEANWEKDSRTSRTRFFNVSGKEISFNRGQIWMEIVPAGNKIKY